MKMDIVMPQMGESVAEGTITKWLKKLGDKVERDEPLLEISTDKVDAEIPSPIAGYLVEIVFPEGKTVEINTKIALISSDQISIEQTTTANSISEKSLLEKIENVVISSVNSDKNQKNTEEIVFVKANELTDIDSIRKLRSSPLVRRIAQTNEVSLSAVKGSGLSGRVTKKDILDFIDVRAKSEDLKQLKVDTTKETSKDLLNSPNIINQEKFADIANSNTSKASVSFEVPPQFLPSSLPTDRLQAMSVMRKKIADHMVWSKRISPHVASFLEIDMTRIAKLRNAKKNSFFEKTGEKLTFMPFIMQATVSALQAYPDCNASILNDDIIYHKNVNLGVAVALDWGLIVPVIRKAEEKNLLGLTSSLNDLANRARSKKLSPDEITLGTFTITNPGAFGILPGTPIISQPQVAILSIGAINKRPWVIESEEGDSIAIRSIMMVSLSYDHRLVDGAVAAKFLTHIRDFLEGYEPSQM